MTTLRRILKASAQDVPSTPEFATSGKHTENSKVLLEETMKTQAEVDPPPPPESPPPPPPPPPVPVADTAKVGKPKGTKRGLEKKEQVDDAQIWVQCEKCQKWRDGPSHALQNLPKHWYCSMNSWDPEFASCEAPQKEYQDEVEKPTRGRSNPPAVEQGERKKKKRLSKVEAETGVTRSSSGEKPTGLRRASKKQVGSGTAGPKVKKPKTQQNSPSGAKTTTNMRNNMLGGSSLPKGKTGKKCDWVMCEKCQKWRKLPPEVDPDQLPEKWFCYMNKWDKERADCSVPQEEEEQQDLAGGEGKNAMVRLPDGVNLYGGQYFQVKGARKHAPSSYRELIVNHYRHFNKYDSTANTFLNVRYYESSLFVPRGNVRGKGVKKTAFEKGQAAAPSTNISHSTRTNRGISNAAIVSNTSFQRLFHTANTLNNPLVEVADKTEQDASSAAPSAVSYDSTTILKDFDFSDPGEDVVEQEHFPSSLLKVSKPWKRAGGWIGTSNYYCVHE